jgi:Txe/YoeB family toxin of Txe-Axe toxin-antitoxin module
VITILPLNTQLNKKIKKYSLEKKFNKQLNLLSSNPKHPSLSVKLLKPKQYGIYSFRIDKKFRALFIFRPDKKAIEILNITLHYQ